MVKAIQWSVMTFYAFFLGWCAVNIGDCSSEVFAEEAAEVTEEAVLAAVELLQPAHAPAVAASWAGVFFEAGAETGIDPLLLVAIGFRESSLRGDIDGDPDLDSRGAMQLRGAARRHMPGECDPHDIGCNVRGGAAFLQFCRAHCNDPRWSIWVGAYGLDHCPTLEEAEGLRSVRRARELYERVGGAGWR